LSPFAVVTASSDRKNEFRQFVNVINKSILVLLIADQHAEVVAARCGLGDRQRDVERERRAAQRPVIDGLVLEERRWPP
jgi:hypothetical protein